jgi:flotillin
MLEHLDHLAAASAEAISNIKFDKVVVWENGGQNGTTNTASFLHGMARTLPPMMQVLRDIGGVEIPDSLVKFAQNEPVTTSSANGAAPAHTAAAPEPLKTGA